jgi:transposase
MSKGIRFTDEFKQDAAAQVVERRYAVSEVAERLRISTKSLYTWKSQFLKPPHVRAEVLDQAAEIKRLKRERHERPIAAFHHHLKMLRCGPSERLSVCG